MIFFQHRTSVEKEKQYHSYWTIWVFLKNDPSSTRQLIFLVSRIQRAKSVPVFKHYNPIYFLTNVTMKFTQNPDASIRQLVDYLIGILGMGHVIAKTNCCLWTPKPWKMKVLHPQNMGYNPQKWRFWVPMVGCILITRIFVGRTLIKQVHTVNSKLLVDGTAIN